MKTRNLLSLGGAGLGALAAGPGGYMAGASAGAALGGLLGGMNDQEESSPKPQVSPLDTGPSDVMQRRMAKLQQDPLAQIRQGIDSLKYVQDDATRAELAKPLFQAEYMAQNKRA